MTKFNLDEINAYELDPSFKKENKKFERTPSQEAELNRFLETYYA